MKSDNQKRYEDERSALEKEGDDFRTRVMRQQRESQSTVEGAADNIDSGKKGIESTASDIKEDISKQKMSVQWEHSQRAREIKDPVGDKVDDVLDALHIKKKE
ncbi:hypothetical protein [Klebsiella sp. PL-2018]|uniref:hypothetical protein n=1 Tax=Klebsiella sp. PL-2018 TaxID=2851540 RepID=UPI001C233E01|nr:hypothetical protein [Klebsiella sp. PL-2018]